MKNSTKKWLTVAGCLVVCAVLVGLIGSQFRIEPPKDEPLPTQSAQQDDVTVKTPTPEKEKEPVVTPPEIPAPSQSANNGAVSSGTEQTIQGDVSKPAYTEEEWKDPAQKPDGKKVTEPPKPVDHDKVERPKDTPKDDSQPQGGDTQDDKIYVPGFGWIENNGGGGQGTTVDGDGDINKQVGTMGE